MKATDTQIGGNHYKDMPFQPVELFAKVKCTPFQANIWKYITRYKYKNGVQDIQKAIHYAQLAIELDCNGSLDDGDFKTLQKFCSANNLSDTQRVITLCTGWNHYYSTIKACETLLQEEYPQEITN